MIDLRIDLDTSAIDTLEARLKQLEQEVEVAIRKTAFHLEREAKARAPVDTGFLRSSIYTVTWKSSTYGLVSAAAKKRGRTMLPAQERPAGKYEAWVAVGAEYGLYVEYGSFHTRGNTKRVGKRAGRIGMKLADGRIVTYIPGYLFMHDAARATQPYFHDQITEAIKRAGSFMK